MNERGCSSWFQVRFTYLYFIKNPFLSFLFPIGPLVPVSVPPRSYTRGGISSRASRPGLQFASDLQTPQPFTFIQQSATLQHLCPQKFCFYFFLKKQQIFSHYYAALVKFLLQAYFCISEISLCGCQTVTPSSCIVYELYAWTFLLCMYDLIFF